MTSAAVESSAASRPRPALPILLGLAALLLLGLATRILFAGRSGLWRDEAQFLFVVREPGVSAMLSFLRDHESHPPLFYLLMRGWQGIFGRSEAATLALPVLLGLLQIPALYLAARRMFGSRRAGLIAAALGATSAPLAYFSAEARPYSLLSLLALLSTYLLWRGMTEPRGRTVNLALYAVTTAALLLTHNWAFLFFAGQWVGSVCAFAAGRVAGLSLRLVPTGIAQAAAAVLFWPWLSSLQTQIQHAGHVPGTLPDPGTLVARLFGWLLVTPREPGDAPVAFALVALAVVGGGLLPLLLWSRRSASLPATVTPPEARVAGVLIVVSLIVALFLAAALESTTGLLFPRTVATLSPLALLLLVRTIERIAAAPATRSVLVAATMTGLLSLAGIATQATLIREVKGNARELAAAVTTQAQPGDLIVISPEWIASDFNYYFRGEQEQIDFPNPGRSEAVWWNDVRARIGDEAALRTTFEKLQEARSAGRRIWFVAKPDDLLPADTPLPPPQAPLRPEWNAGSVTAIRTNQIARFLNELYGVPEGARMVTTPQPGPDKYAAYLYTAGYSKW